MNSTRQNRLFLFKRISMLLLSISCCFASLQADFVSLSVWERTTAKGEKQHLILLGDKHDLVAKAEEQANDLIKFLRERNRKSDCILIENMANFKPFLDYASQYLRKQEKYTSDSKESILEGFSSLRMPALKAVVLSRVQKYAYQYDIKVINLEHRYLVCKIDDSVHPLWYPINYFMLNQTLEELKKYNDGEALNHFYKDILNRYIEVQEMLQKHVSIETMINKHPKYKRLGKEHPGKNSCEDLDETFFTEVLDTRVLHDVYQRHIKQEQSSLITVCAGAFHTFNIETILPKLGYEYLGGRPFYSPCLDEYRMPVDIKSYLNDIFPSKLQAKL